MTPYYDKDGITIYCGDCLDVMPGLDGPFDAIIADLPYGTTACDWDTVIPLDALWVEYKRLIKGRGAVVLFGSQPFTTDLINSNREWFAYTWYWKKERGTGFVTVSKQPLKIIEEICIFYESGTTYNPQNKPLDKPYKHILPKINSQSGSKSSLGTVKTGVDIYKTYTYSSPNTLLSFARDNGTKTSHPTQKPIALLAYLIRTYTNPGEIILDNTIGSGTTLVAAQREGRRAVGIEISEDYCKIATERLRQPSFFSIPQQTNGKAKATQPELFNE